MCPDLCWIEKIPTFEHVIQSECELIKVLDCCRKLDLGGGEVSGPSPVDIQWLQCKTGMSADALTLARLPSILDDAIKRAGGAKPVQMVVGQGPCGTASIYIPFDNSRWVQYEGDGVLKKVE